MDLMINKSSFFVFDLDDTLYSEFDFLKSGFKKISEFLFPIIGHSVYLEMMEYYLNGKEVISNILTNYELKSVQVKDLLDIYRYHSPNIILNNDARVLLDTLLSLKIGIGIITDGRSRTQRNKLKALNILDKFNMIIISEEFGSSKPNVNNFKVFEDTYPRSSFYYFGDNIEKDFVAPNKLGWKTFCLLDNGKNIHKQDFNCNSNYLPYQSINSFSEINLIYE